MINSIKEFSLYTDQNNSSSISLDRIYNACLNINSNECMSVKNTCDVFLSIVPNNETLANARRDLDNSDKAIRSRAKIIIKNEINDLLSKIRKVVSTKSFKDDADKMIDSIEEINNHPRLAETRFALSRGIKPKEIQANNANSVWILYDRHGQEQGKALGIFKACPNLASRKEVEVSEQLSKLNKINVKQTLKQEFEIQKTKKQGIFQKFIPGKMIREGEPTDSEAVEQIQFIGIFDLINRNADRNDGNIMIDTKGKVWAIDHERVDSIKEAYNDDRVSMIFLKAAYQPFSQKLKDHINTLDINQHVIKSLRDSKDRLHIEKMIGFLKWAVSDNRTIPLTLAQIYYILGGALKIPLPSNENYKNMLENSLKRRFPSMGGDWLILRDLFPEVEQLHKKSFNVEVILEKSSRLGNFAKIRNESFLDLLLANQDKINYSKVAIHKRLKKQALTDLIETVAEDTKYYDNENKSLTKDFKDFLGHFSTVALGLNSEQD